jgi:hypothetical protein
LAERPRSTRPLEVSAFGFEPGRELGGVQRLFRLGGFEFAFDRADLARVAIVRELGALS